MTKVSTLLSFVSAPLIFLFASCADSTPASRIQNHPTIYNGLSSKHKQLVSQGKIDRGMTKPAVFLALGHPDRRVESSRQGTSYSRWDYNELVPVYHHGISTYTGYGWGRRGWRGSRYGIGISPSVSYVPRRGSSVVFKSGKVTGWDRISR